MRWNQTEPRMMNVIITIAIFQCLTYCARAERDDKSKFVPKIQLNDGHSIPVLGLGTFQTGSTIVEKAVKYAIDIGYRHIDTAWIYRNEKGVGNAIRAKIAEGVIKREDIFVTTKLWNTFHEPNQVRRAFQKSFDNLNIGYIDLYLMHTPVAYQRISIVKNGSLDDTESIIPLPVGPNKVALTLDIDYVDTWREMEQLLETGKVRSLGVSNFNSQQLDRLVSLARIKPVANQIECHPNLNQIKSIAFARERNVTIIGYSPLGRPQAAGNRKLAFKDKHVQEMAENYNKTVGQILLRYSHQNGAVIIPKSTKRQHLRDNIDIFDFNLNETDVNYLNSLSVNSTRLFPFNSDKESKYYPFNIEF